MTRSICLASAIILCFAATNHSAFSQADHAAPATPEAMPGQPSNLLEIQQALGKLATEQNDVSDQFQLHNRTDTRNHLDAIKLDLAGKRVREKAIQDKINELTDQAMRQIADDPTLKALQKIADIKDADVARNQQLAQKAIVPSADVDKAIADAADTQVRILERREAITAQIGGGILPELNKQLIQLSLDITEQSAIEKVLEDRLDKMDLGQSKVRDLDAEQRRLETLRDQLRNNNGFNPRGRLAPVQPPALPATTTPQ